MALVDNSRRLALVGVAKNCGKTTTLNWLIANSPTRTVGLASVGVDGERLDVILGTPKPPVFVRPGVWVASAEQALATATCELAFHEDLGFETPMGRMLIAEVLSEGELVLAGLRYREDMHHAAQALESCGADLVLLDGAYGRVVGAKPGLTDGVVVSTGAVIGDIDEIIEATASLVGRLTLPPARLRWHDALITKALENNAVCWGSQGVLHVSESRSAILGLQFMLRDVPEDAAIAIPGALTNNVVDELLSYGPSSCALLVADGTSIHCDLRHLVRLQKQWEILVKNPISLVAISVNPNGLHGWSVPSKDLMTALRSQWPNVPIFDPHVGLSS